MKFYKHTEGGTTVFMVAGEAATEAVKRMESVSVPVSVNFYASTTVVIVKDDHAAAVEK